MLFAISVDALCYNEPTPLKMLLAMLKQIYANHSVRYASALHSAQRRCYTTVCGWVRVDRPEAGWLVCLLWRAPQLALCQRYTPWRSRRRGPKLAQIPRIWLGLVADLA